MTLSQPLAPSAGRAVRRAAIWGLLGLIPSGCGSAAEAEPDSSPGGSPTSNGTSSSDTGGAAELTSSTPTGAGSCPDLADPVIVLTVEDEVGEPVALPSESVAVSFEGGMPAPVVSGSGSLENPLDIPGEPGRFEVLVFVQGYEPDAHELEVFPSADGCGPQTVHSTVTLETTSEGTSGGCSLAWIPSLVVEVQDDAGATVPLPPGSASHRVPGAEETAFEGDGPVLRQPLAVRGPPGLTQISVSVEGFEPQTVAERVVWTEDGCHPETVSRVMTLQASPDRGE